VHRDIDTRNIGGPEDEKVGTFQVSNNESESKSFVEGRTCVA
jgi:hypothetical protein